MDCLAGGKSQRRPSNKGLAADLSHPEATTAPHTLVVQHKEANAVLPVQALRFTVFGIGMRNCVGARPTLSQVLCCAVIVRRAKLHCSQCLHPLPCITALPDSLAMHLAPACCPLTEWTMHGSKAHFL